MAPREARHSWKDHRGHLACPAVGQILFCFGNSSAAIEYLKSPVQEVARGAAPGKNNRGVYVDYQMLLYLGESDIEFLTCENFSGEVTSLLRRIES